jgi:hypothetical protein
MMETSLLVLGTLQVLALLLYRWVVKVYVSRPIFSHFGIFLNPVLRTLFCYGPLLAMFVLVVLAFFFTQLPWLFLGLSVAGFVACSAPPRSYLVNREGSADPHWADLF